MTMDNSNDMYISAMKNGDFVVPIPCVRFTWGGSRLAEVSLQLQGLQRVVDLKRWYQGLGGRRWKFWDFSWHGDGSLNSVEEVHPNKSFGGKKFWDLFLVFFVFVFSVEDLFKILPVALVYKSKFGRPCRMVIQLGWKYIMLHIQLIVIQLDAYSDFTWYIQQSPIPI